MSYFLLMARLAATIRSAEGCDAASGLCAGSSPLWATAKERLSTLYLSYYVQPKLNVIAIAVVSSANDALTRICAELNIKFFTDYSIAQCSES